MGYNHPMPRNPPPPKPQQENLFGSSTAPPTSSRRSATPRRPSSTTSGSSETIADEVTSAPATQRATQRAARRAAERAVFTVSRLNSEVRGLLEKSLRTVWVEGEISNLSRPGSGHVYFTLKDARAQVRCALFRQRAQSTGPLRDGQKVLVRGQLTVYEARGEYQIQVDTVEETGEGALRRAYEELKKRLAAEGLFATERKRTLPTLPQRIGVLTSPTGAAVRDILHVLGRRFPAVPVRIYPIPVQGPEAAPRIIAQLRKAERRRDCDVLILARGGGSLEDLWAFNEERVARAIAACDIALVSAIGHETDITIADLVADLRAPTPSAAAESVVPDGIEWLRQLRTLEQRLLSATRAHVARSQQRFRWMQGRLRQQHPAMRLRQNMQRVDELGERLRRLTAQRMQGTALRLRNLQERLGRVAPGRRIEEGERQLATLRQRLGAAATRLARQRAERLGALEARLNRASPTHRLPALIAQQQSVQTRLEAAARRQHERLSARLARAADTLHAVSPLATLSRGYAIVERSAERTILRSAAQASVGESVRARLGEGTIEARVTAVEPKGKG
ncbi:MAG: exodeoxyribonuclease VII large subunit [Pseudomonadota bacterium]